MKALMTLLMVLGSFGMTPAASAAGKAPPKVIELETMVIEGKIAKPQVFYVLGRSRIQYAGIQLQKTFVDRIVTSAQKNPF